VRARLVNMYSIPLRRDRDAPLNRMNGLKGIAGIRGLGGLPVVMIVLALGSVGCNQPTNTIAQVDPYVGKRPPPMTELPQKETPAPEPTQPRGRPTGPMAGWMPPGGISDRWQCVVIHHSDSDKSTPEGMREWHVKGRGWDALGYHFVIGNGVGYPDGKVYVGERWTKQMHGAHCKTPGNHYNDHGVGICLIGNLDSHPPTAKQMQALAKLTSFLTGKCGIPQSRIYTHGGVTHKTACPGRHFNLPNLLRQLSAISLGENDPDSP